MKKRFGVIAFAAVATFLSLPSVSHAAMCANDAWSVRFSRIRDIAKGTAEIYARSKISHFGEHPGCEGIIWAKARLIGMNASCTQQGGLNHTSPFTLEQISQTNCGGLSCGLSYHAGGEHWWHFDDPQIDPIPPSTESGYSTSTGTVSWTCEEEPPPCDEECQCAMNGGLWEPDPYSESYGCNYSPILINVRSNAADAHLTSAADGVRFDMGGLGNRVQIAWTERDSSVGFLTLDLNGNGTVDTGTELFGSLTLLRNGARAPNGFEALKELDDNADGQIDRSDRVFGRLKLWFDRNHDGVSQSGELSRLPDADIVAIFTAYAGGKRVDRFGNAYKYSGKVVMDWGEGPVERRIFDVFLTTARETKQ